MERKGKSGRSNDNDSEVQSVEDKPLRKGDLRRLEGRATKAEGREPRKSSEEPQGYFGCRL